jgi:RNA polymerase sigma-70 factor (ECF subfamily)
VDGGAFGVLLAEAKRGDEHAFACLWRDVNSSLVRYLRVVSADDADDIAADTWISVVRSLSRFEGDEEAWRCWVFAIARRRAIDHGRRRSRRPEYAALDADAGYDAVGGDVADEALQNLGTREALRLVASLPPAQAEMLMLRVVAGLDVEAVARIVGKSPGAVRVAVHRSLKSLAQLLQPSV